MYNTVYIYIYIYAYIHYIWRVLGAPPSAHLGVCASAAALSDACLGDAIDGPPFRPAFEFLSSRGMFQIELTLSPAYINLRCTINV